MILKQFIELQSFLETPKNIVIVGHRNPDGDAMGATLGLYHYLKKKGHNPTVVVPNKYIGYQVLKILIGLIGRILNLKELLMHQILYFY